MTIVVRLELDPHRQLTATHAPVALEAAELLEQLTHGDRQAALGAVLASALEMLAIGDVKAASLGLGAASVMCSRIAAARLEWTLH